jgi:RHS repeat-associated protein
MNKRMFYMAILISFPVFVSVAEAEVSLVNQYDANGNLSNGDGKYYQYNDVNQLVRVRAGDQNGPIVSEYSYDYAGKRVKKVDYDAAGKKTTTYYVGNYYETQVADGVAANTSYTENTSYYFADGERVGKKDSTGNYFFHPDHLGGVNVVTNGNGAVVDRTSYLPFGEIQQGGAEKYSYTGKEKDKATDLYYFDARYNNPDLRHFTQADVAEPDLDDPQDLNRYAYVGNNPLSYVDPDGHTKKKKHSKKEKHSKKDKKENGKDKARNQEYVYEKYESGSYGGQCTDLAKAITTFSGRLGSSYEEKKELLNNSSAGFRRGERTIDVGDILVLNVGTYGHVAVVIGVNKGSLEIIESNVPMGSEKVKFETIDKNDTRIYGAYNTNLR